MRRASRPECYAITYSYYRMPIDYFAHVSIILFCHWVYYRDAAVLSE